MTNRIMELAVQMARAYSLKESKHFSTAEALLKTEVARVEAELAHWKEARQNALDGGDLLKTELAECRAKLAEITSKQLETRRKHQEDYEALHDAVATHQAYLCKAWGETDLPSASIVNSLRAARSFLIAEWLGAECEEADEAIEQMQQCWLDEREWALEFEIGGISVERVFEAALAAGARE